LRPAPTTARGGAISVDLHELIAAFQDLGEAAAKPGADVMQLAAEDLMDGVQENFATQGHGRWPGLAESTLKRRGTGAQILVDTGRLRASIHADVGASHVEVTTDTAYGMYHVTGTSRMQRRDFLDIDEAALNAAADTIVDGILEVAGFQ
jgi:phage gpG-like protein